MDNGIPGGWEPMAGGRPGHRAMNREHPYRAHQGRRDHAWLISRKVVADPT